VLTNLPLISAPCGQPNWGYDAFKNWEEWRLKWVILPNIRRSR